MVVDGSVVVPCEGIDIDRGLDERSNDVLVTLLAFVGNPLFWVCVGV